MEVKVCPNCKTEIPTDLPGIWSCSNCGHIYIIAEVPISNDEGE